MVNLVTVVKALQSWVYPAKREGTTPVLKEYSCYEYHRHPKQKITTTAEGKNWRGLE